MCGDGSFTVSFVSCSISRAPQVFLSPPQTSRLNVQTLRSGLVSHLRTLSTTPNLRVHILEMGQLSYQYLMITRKNR